MFIKAVSGTVELNQYAVPSMGKKMSKLVDSVDLAVETQCLLLELLETIEYAAGSSDCGCIHYEDYEEADKKFDVLCRKLEVISNITDNY